MEKILLLESFVVDYRCFKEVKKPITESVTVVNEKGEKESVKILRTIQGPMGVIGEKTGNGRFYSVKMMEEVLKSIKQLMEGRALMGMMDHPKAEPKLGGVSHVISNLWLEDRNGKTIMFGEWDIVNTNAGRDLNGLYEAQAGIGTSFRGYGLVKEDGEVTEYDFRGVDAVFDPAAGTFISEKYVFEKAASTQPVPVQEEMKKEMDRIMESIMKVQEEVRALRVNDGILNQKLKLTEQKKVISEVVTSPNDMTGLESTARCADGKEEDKTTVPGAAPEAKPQLPQTLKGGQQVTAQGKDGLMGTKTGAAPTTPAVTALAATSVEAEEKFTKALQMVEALKQFITKDVNIGSVIEMKEAVIQEQEGDETSLVVSKTGGTPQLFRIAKIEGDKVVMTAVGGEVEIPRSDFDKQLAIGQIIKVPEQPEKATEVPSVSIEAPAGVGVQKGEEEEAYVKNLEIALSEVRDYSLTLEKVITGLRDYAWKLEAYSENMEKVLTELRDYALKAEGLSEDLTEKLKKSFAVIEGLRDYALNLENVSENLVGKNGTKIVEAQNEINAFVSKTLAAFPILEQFKEELSMSMNVAAAEARVRKYLSLFERLGQSHLRTVVTEKKTKDSGNKSGERLLDNPGLKDYE